MIALVKEMACEVPLNTPPVVKLLQILGTGLFSPRSYYSVIAAQSVNVQVLHNTVLKVDVFPGFLS